MKRFISLFFADFVRAFKVLNPKLRLRSIELFALMVTLGLLELTFILTLTYMGAALTSPDTLRTNFLFRAIFAVAPDLRIWCKDPRYLVILAGFIVVIASIGKNVISFATYHRMAKLGEDISISIGHEIMERYLYRDYAWHLSAESASTFQRMAWRNVLTQLLINLLGMYSSVVTMLILFGSLVGKEPVLSSFVVVATGGIGLLVYQGLRHQVDKCAHLSATAAERETKAVLCATKGIRDVIIYRQQPQFLLSVTEAAELGKVPRMLNIIAPIIPTWVLEATGFAVMVLAVTYLIFVQEADIPRITTALALLTLTAWRVLPYCNRIMGHQVTIRALRPMAHAVLKLLESLRESRMELPPAPDPNFRFEKQVELKNVSFRYPDANEDSLHQINLTIKKGTRIGFVGPSGAGKSTLVGVLCGLLPPTEGQIIVDNKQMSEAQAAAFAAMMGYVPQSPFLFAGTLAENVAFSHWGQPWHEGKVRTACDMAAVDFVGDHPSGVRLPIGENGAGLSGGQAQRVSIARALYADPSIIIFDEATSALDQGNESIILNTIRNLPGSVTCIIIAHRLTTVEYCDLLVWIDQGRVKQIGPPSEILPQYRASYTHHIIEEGEFPLA
ncbi:ABC transporter ATP-binding protein [Desulfocurvibacter africanus]|uniref:Xenobiotic-transporting ATPase n=1 Tax=Desulfocurvibacter africanus subsp. africanus str. Walvis Bay TaxID=690850 RepID=F3YWI2_DESAF|nr:ABC transporter ATP-binding protein [Desulfocurvibacter africanus]EGJ49368.1 Xenobiotic-transporting ATPase [Desulfocurvibacter africanus subsp. africanus str. Walvis Bay]